MSGGWAPPGDGSGRHGLAGRLEVPFPGCGGGALVLPGPVWARLLPPEGQAPSCLSRVSLGWRVWQGARVVFGRRSAGFWDIRAGSLGWVGRGACPDTLRVSSGLDGVRVASWKCTSGLQPGRASDAPEEIPEARCGEAEVPPPSK